MDESTVSLSNSMSSSQPRQLIESNYKLALKLFMNKSFGKSYEIIKKLYQSSFKQFASDTIGEKLFVKILNLYLTEIGLFIDSKDINFNLSRIEKQEAITTLAQDKILNELYITYNEDLNAIPTEILYNLYLIYYINGSTISDKGHLRSKFDKLYYQFDYASKHDDIYLKKFVDLYVFQVLPDDESLDDAGSIIQQNPLYQSEVEESLNRLNNIRMNKVRTQEEEAYKQREQQRKLQEKKEREVQNQKELKEKQNLTYKSLNQIKQSSGNVDISKKDDRNIRSDQGYDINYLREKLFYSFNLSKNYIKENSPLILLIIIILFITSKFLKVRKINIMEKMKQTLQMAFKISYL